jgi:hypothetical protein
MLRIGSEIKIRVRRLGGSAQPDLQLADVALRWGSELESGAGRGLRIRMEAAGGRADSGVGRREHPSLRTDRRDRRGVPAGPIQRGSVDFQRDLRDVRSGAQAAVLQ